MLAHPPRAARKRASSYTFSHLGTLLLLWKKSEVSVLMGNSSLLKQRSRDAFRLRRVYGTDYTKTSYIKDLSQWYQGQLRAYRRTAILRCSTHRYAMLAV